MEEVMAALPADHPLMLAWEEYKKTFAYANSFKWAAQAEHRDGSMFAAFAKGWEARQKID
jgi:hypothetical protein